MSGDDLILETRGLSKEFEGFVAVSNVDLRVRRGTIHALIGPNGAGKTTVFNLVTKFHTPTSGQIFFSGKEITGADPAELPRRGMCRSFQISATFPHLTCLENVRIALQRKLDTSYHFWRSERSLDALGGRAMEFLADVGLTELGQVPAGELPYGRKRALELATTLALEPEILLLDEPTSGLGQEDIARITDLIRKVAAGRTVLMVEHNLGVVADLSSTITVMQRGEILAEGRYEQVSADPRVIEAYMGTGHG